MGSKVAGAEQTRGQGFQLLERAFVRLGPGSQDGLKTKSKASESTAPRWRVDKLSTRRSAREVEPLRPKLGASPYSWLKRSKL